MAYVIKRYLHGYRVYSVSGTPLSHKPLSYKKAVAQRTAANLSFIQKELRGGSYSQGDEGYALSDKDIQEMLGGTNIFRYPELSEMNSIEDAFDDKGRAMMLYLTENQNVGQVLFGQTRFQQEEVTPFTERHFQHM